VDLNLVTDRLYCRYRADTDINHSINLPHQPCTDETPFKQIIFFIQIGILLKHAQLLIQSSVADDYYACVKYFVLIDVF